MAPSRGGSWPKGSNKGRREKLREEDIMFVNQGWGDVAINLVTGDFYDEDQTWKIRKQIERVEDIVPEMYRPQEQEMFEAVQEKKNVTKREQRKKKKRKKKVKGQERTSNPEGKRVVKRKNEATQRKKEEF